jgi:catechol 2,3-dioxygenase-like lactoylglutathione lyase family enzyme
MQSAQIILYVRDQERATKFYDAVLGVAPILHVPNMTEYRLATGCILGLMPSASIVRLLAGAIPDPESANGVPRAELYLMVDEPQAYLDRALAAGATGLSPLQPHDWGHEAAYCLDLDRHVLAFAREIAEG